MAPVSSISTCSQEPPGNPGQGCGARCFQGVGLSGQAARVQKAVKGVKTKRWPCHASLCLPTGSCITTRGLVSEMGIASVAMLSRALPVNASKDAGFEDDTRCHLEHKRRRQAHHVQHGTSEGAVVAIEEWKHIRGDIVRQPNLRSCT